MKKKKTSTMPKKKKKLYATTLVQTAEFSEITKPASGQIF